MIKTPATSGSSSTVESGSARNGPDSRSSTSMAGGVNANNNNSMTFSATGAAPATLQLATASDNPSSHQFTARAGRLATPYPLMTASSNISHMTSEVSEMVAAPRVHRNSILRRSSIAGRSADISGLDAALQPAISKRKLGAASNEVTTVDAKNKSKFRIRLKQLLFRPLLMGQSAKKWLHLFFVDLRATMTPRDQRLFWRHVVATTFSIFVVAVATLLLWCVSATYVAYPQALADLQSDNSIIISGESDLLPDCWLFIPRLNSTNPPPAAQYTLLFFGESKVDYRAYAPFLKAVALNTSMTAILVEPPLMQPELIGSVFERLIDVRGSVSPYWILAGHGNGATAQLSALNRLSDSLLQRVKGVLIFGSKIENIDLRGRNLSQYVSVISAQLDLLQTVEEISASIDQWSVVGRTTHQTIDGANHAGFGYYGPHVGDVPATISRIAQRDAMVAAAGALLNSLLV